MILENGKLMKITKMKEKIQKKREKEKKKKQRSI